MNTARGLRPANDQTPDAPLSVVVRGDEVLVLGSHGAVQALSVRAAETSVTRLLDAIAIAQGRMPSVRR